MKREFKKNIVKQRDRLKLTDEMLKKRIDKSPFGKKTKELAKKWRPMSPMEVLGGVFLK